MKLKEIVRDLTRLVHDMDKQFGKGTIMRLGDAPAEAMSVFSSGSLALDAALGVGGVPRGRLVEIFGPESSGKTTLALHCIAEAQREGGVAAFIDAEHALDISYAKRLGVAVDDLLVSQPDCGEQALDIAEALVRSGSVDLIVVDSVAALVPRAELEGEMGDSHVGLQARLMSQALRKLTAVAHRQNVTIIFINQIRMKIGVMFGSPETTTGGNALKYYASVRLDIRRTETIKQGDVSTGNHVRVKVVKNKTAPPFRQAEFDILFGEGISRASEVFDIGVARGVIEKNGAFYRAGEERLGQGREAAITTLREQPELRERLEKEVRRLLATTPAQTEAVQQVAEAA